MSDNEPKRIETPEQAAAFVTESQDAMLRLITALRDAHLPCDRLTAGALLALAATGYAGERESFIRTGIALYKDGVEHARERPRTVRSKGGQA